MGRLLTNHRTKRTLRIMILYVTVSFGAGILRHGMAARKQGMDVPSALWEGLRLAIPDFPVYLIGILIAFAVILLIQNRKVPVGTPPVEAGRMRFLRTRIIGMAASALLILFTAVWAAVLYERRNGQIEQSMTLLVWMAIFSVLMLLLTWGMRPTREGLYAIETGDTSRANDERMQSLMGKSANTAINIFLAFLVFVILPYQAIVSGYLPVETLVEIGVLLVIRTGTFNYWNRRL